jgi:hypothetical protein
MRTNLQQQQQLARALLAAARGVLPWASPACAGRPAWQLPACAVDAQVPAAAAAAATHASHSWRGAATSTAADAAAAAAAAAATAPSRSSSAAVLIRPSAARRLPAGVQQLLEAVSFQQLHDHLRQALAARNSQGARVCWWLPCVALLSAAPRGASGLQQQQAHTGSVRFLSSAPCAHAPRPCTPCTRQRQARRGCCCC